MMAQLKKTRCQLLCLCLNVVSVGPPLTKLSGSAHGTCKYFNTAVIREMTYRLMPYKAIQQLECTASKQHRTAGQI